MLPKFKDVTGQRFGRLIAKKYVGKDKNNQSLWLCECDCGNEEVITNIHYLTSGDTKSCGCLKKEQLIERNKKYNIYDLSGEYGIGYLNNNEEFYFDLEDYDLIKDYCWQVSSNGYIYNKTSKEYILLHRLILNLLDDESLTGDHADLNKKNNRKYNLRICSMQKNSFNRGLYKNNTSGTTGVFWNDRMNKWTAQIKHNYKNIILGYYDNIEDAIDVRKQAEEELFGEYSYDNSQKYVAQYKMQI